MQRVREKPIYGEEHGVCHSNCVVLAREGEVANDTVLDSEVAG
jgi:hypothetical protein